MCLSLTRLPQSTGWWLGSSTKNSNICTLLGKNKGGSSCQSERLMIGLLFVSVSLILQDQQSEGEAFYSELLRIISGSEWSGGC